VDKAIDYFRAEAYYDQLDLGLRLQACSEDLYVAEKREQLINRCIAIIGECISENNEILDSLLDEISFRVYPKSLEEENEDNSKHNRWISNLRTKREYIVKNCDFLIDLPLELRILDTLWTMRVGRKLDFVLPDTCYANRFAPKNHKNLFSLYFNQYKKWRDTGLTRAQKCLENNQSVALLSMDISRYYYNIETSWGLIQIKCTNDPINCALTNVLQKIQSRYLNICKPFCFDCGIEITSNRKYLLPIGPLSSRVLANWALRTWDRKIQRALNPVYYGRYVDDMLIVLSNPPSECTKDIHSLIDTLLIRPGFLSMKRAGDLNIDEQHYELAGTKFSIKASKLIGTYFDKNHSWAGLTSFIEEIKKHSSEFRFLPTDEQGRELENTAFDILMQGSVNKIRSILAISENGTELSKFISSEIIAHRLSKAPIKKSLKEQLSRFWKGRNLFDFIRIWEKNFTLMFIKSDKTSIIEFWEQIEDIIKRLKHNNNDIKIKLKENLREHRALAFANTIALGKTSEFDFWVTIINGIPHTTGKNAFTVRKAGFCRSQYIVWPFLQCTQFEGDLAQLSMGEVIQFLQDNEINPSDSFRYVYEHEKQIVTILKNASRGIPNNTTMGQLGLSEGPETIFEESDEPIDIKIQDESEIETGNLVVGIANLSVPFANIQTAYEPGSEPVLTQQRWQTLSTLLNLAAKKEKCDLLVLPEVSIPWAWFPLMITHAQRHGIGLIFGLEHLVVNIKKHDYVNNTVIAVLPYIKDGHTQCAVIARSKNHYSPEEENEFYRLNYNPVSPEPKQYHLIHWRGITFTIFNCFELTDIAHRSVFRGKVDALIAVEWNKDTDYFSNIMETTACDLHCTIIQVNTSDFGDSRIYTPYHDRYKRNIIRVKGGDNTTLLKTTLNFEEQRNFQQKKNSPADKRYKPKPAGFSYER
jgi:hypothetical protein